jgi:hypothetical protein
MGTQLEMSYTREQNFARTQAKLVKPRPKANQGHFDPDELTRRLYLVLADQKIHAERKRIRQEEAKLRDARSWTSRHHSSKDGAKSKEAVLERSSSKTKPTDKPPSGDQQLQKQKSLKLNKKDQPAAKPIPNPSSIPPTADQQTSYHHIPQEAAKQFTRTTTVDGMRDPSNPGSNLVHKISKQALKYHLTGRQPPTTDTHNRTAIRHDRIPEEVEEEPPTPPEDKHTFHNELIKVLPPDQRRNSTGDLLVRATSEDHRRSMVLVDSLAEALVEDGTPEREALSPREVNEHRVDWTQSDEMRLKEQPAVTAQRRTVLSPLLRKADSIWMLRGRLGSGSSGKAEGDCEKIRSESPTKSPGLKSPGPKSPKVGGGGGGFFAKFKR